MIQKLQLFRLLSQLWGPLILLQCTTPPEKDATRGEEYRMVGYVAGWTEFDLAGIDHAKLTHLNYAFANIQGGKAVMELNVDSANLATLVAFRESNQDLSILLSVGGWVWSNWFSDVALTGRSRDLFAESLIALIQKHDLDGVDLDWEYPGQRAEDNVFRPVDRENFTLLLKAVREKLDRLGKENGDRPYLLTIASAADQAYFDHTDLGEAHQYLDFINVMTYDFYNGWMYQTGHHANLHPSDRERFGGNSIVEAVERHLAAGVPAEKLVLGFPFYGRLWEGVHVAADGLYQPASTGGLIIPYRSIMGLDTIGWENLWDTSASAPYLWNPETQTFISYETPASIGLKVNYIKDQGLSGAMFWEYSDDPDQQLLDALCTGLNEE